MSEIAGLSSKNHSDEGVFVCFGPRPSVSCDNVGSMDRTAALRLPIALCLHRSVPPGSTSGGHGSGNLGG